MNDCCVRPYTANGLDLRGAGITYKDIYLSNSFLDSREMLVDPLACSVLRQSKSKKLAPSVLVFADHGEDYLLVYIYACSVIGYINIMHIFCRKYRLMDDVK